MPEPVTATPTQDAPADQKPAGASVQDRINQVTRQRHEAERKAAGLETQVADQQTQIQTLQSQISTLSQSPAPQAQLPQYDPLGGAFGQTIPQHVPPQAPAGQQNAPDNAALQRMVADAVKEAIDPVTSAISQGKRQSALQSEFNQLAAEIPDLANQDSAVYKAWEQVWNGRPELASLEGGLQLSVAAAQGLVGSTPSAAQAEAQKVAATTVTPNQPGSQLLTQPTDAKKAGELANELMTQGAEKGLSTSDWEAFLAAQLGATTPE